MAFISMKEVLATRPRFGTGKNKYLYLGYGVTRGESKKYPNRKDKPMLVFILTPELLKKAGLKDGEKVNVLYERTTREGIIERDDEGQRLYTHTKASRNYRLQYPYVPETGFPRTRGMQNIDEGIHISGKGTIRFTLKNIKEYNGDNH